MKTIGEEDQKFVKEFIGRDHIHTFQFLLLHSTRSFFFLKLHFCIFFLCSNELESKLS